MSEGARAKSIGTLASFARNAFTPASKAPSNTPEDKNMVEKLRKKLRGGMNDL